jgi:hypothetical protein
MRNDGDHCSQDPSEDIRAVAHVVREAIASGETNLIFPYVKSNRLNESLLVCQLALCYPSQLCDAQAWSIPQYFN